uniref:Uncharacterized protein n=1 Tax=Lepeophtheirus salmonis TaxID=72036 RepID=A0A0K2UIY6_LEPSM
MNIVKCSRSLIFKVPVGLGDHQRSSRVFRTNHPIKQWSWESWRPTARICLLSFLRLDRKSARRPTARC